MALKSDLPGNVTQWARILQHRELSNYDIPPDGPTGFLCVGGNNIPLNYAVYSERSAYCFNLPRDEVRPEVLAVFDTCVPHGFDLYKVRQSFTDPSRGVPGGEEGFWINCFACDLQILLKDDRSVEFLQALLSDTVNKLPGHWFENKEWKTRAVQELCAMLTRPKFVDIGSGGDAVELADILQATANSIFIERREREVNLESLELYGEHMLPRED